jgi:drug/metabolite transporter (DMT)-like permease
MVALGLALGASIAWGGSDFLAGLVTRRLPVLTVLAVSQGFGLVLLLALLALADQPAPAPGAVLAAAGAGCAEVIGFAALYRSLALGPMSVVAPLSSLAALVPVGAEVASGGLPRAGMAAGLAVALCGGALVSLERGTDGAARPRVAPGAVLASVSALGFGLFFVAMDVAADEGGVAWTVSVTRATSLAALMVALVVGRRGVACRAGDLRAAGIVGLLDAGANALFALALTEGLASTVSVIGSLYPVTTIVLATVLLRERPRAVQALGIVGVLVGVGLVSAYGGG